MSNSIAADPKHDAREPIFSNADLRRLIVPLFAEQLLVSSIGLVSVFMVSSVGEAAVSGVSLVDSINMLIVMLFGALSTGGAVVVSQYLGRRDSDSASNAAKLLLYISAALAVLVTVFCMIFTKQILTFIFSDVGDEIMLNAQRYFFITAMSYPFLSIYNSGVAIFRAMGKSRISMTNSLIMNIINVILCIVLVRVLDFGVIGAAFSILVCRIFSALFFFKLLQNPQNPVHIRRMFRPEFNLGMTKSILRVGIPSGIENSIFQVGKLMLAGLITTFGDTSTSASAIINNLMFFACLPGSAMGLALITVVGQCVGAGDYAAATKYTKKLMTVAMLGMITVNALMIIFMRPLIGLYNLTPPTEELTIFVMTRYCIFAALLNAPAFAFPNALRAAGDARFTMVMSIATMWIFRIGLSYVFGVYMNLGLMGIWYAGFCDWLARTIIFVARFVGGKWKTKRVI